VYHFVADFLFFRKNTEAILILPARGTTATASDVMSGMHDIGT